MALDHPALYLQQLLLLITCIWFLCRVIPKWKDITRKSKGEDWRLDVEISFGQYEIMINLNNVKCAIKDSDVTNNIMNIFFCRIFEGVPRDTWIAPMQLMNTLCTIDVKQWMERIGEFMHWKMVKGKSHHIFPWSPNCKSRCWATSGVF